MLTSDKEYNKDFDTNNLFLNLDFQNQEETFEYKYPLLDHPSNYQLIVTKFLTRTSLPYIKLEDSKKRPVDGSRPNDSVKKRENFLYDYPIRADFFLLEDNETLYNLNVIQYLITPNGGEDAVKRFADVYLMPFDTMENIVEQQKYFDVMNEYEDEELPNLHGWHDSNDHRNIYSLNDIYLMINETLRELLRRVGVVYNDFRDELFSDIADIYQNGWCIFFKVENNVPKLYIRKELFDQMFTTNGYWTEDKQLRLTKIFFPTSLMKFFKGLPIRPFKEYGEYCYIYYNSDTTAVREKLVNSRTKKTFIFYVFTGERINLTEISDYIGVAITSPDFPVKEQIYPHFNFDFEKDFGRLNRRRYISNSEQNIAGIFNRNNVNEIILENEHVNDLTKSSIGEKILFVKYLGKGDELNCINYENNNINTTQKMDLMNVMPLKKFTLKLYLIDRYNNFEPLCPQIKGYEDVIKLQLLFTRIKGSEKENRNFIETKMTEPEKVHLDIFEEEEEEEEGENVEEQQILAVPVPVPVPVPVTDEGEEENLEPPPEKKIYLNQEEEEIENPENELY